MSLADLFKTPEYKAQPSNVPLEFWVDAVMVGNQYGVDPYLLSAIGEAETNFGTLGAGRDGYALGVGVYNTGDPNTQYKGLLNQLTWAAKSISQNMTSDPITEQGIEAYNQKAHYSLNDNGSVNEQWAKNVFSDYQTLTKDATSQGNVFSNGVHDAVAPGTTDVGSWFSKFFTMNTLFIVGGSLGVILILVNIAKGGRD